MVAPKAEIPLYHQNREHGRPSFSRRKRASAGSKRRSGGNAMWWWMVIISPLVLVAFCLGTFLGIELARAPTSKDTALIQGGSYLPPLEHPNQGGWDRSKGQDISDPHTVERLRAAERDRRAGKAPHTPPTPRQPAEVPGGLRGEEGGAGGGVEGAAAAVAALARDGMEITGSAEWLKEHAFHARDGAFVSVKESLDHSQEVTAMAWVYLDRESADIKTIFGNKMSGCGADALGFALHINEWEKKDGELWLEWGDGASGCRKLRSGVKVPVGSWVHVAARFSGHDVATFIDGKRVANVDGSRRPGSREEFTIGSFASGGFAFDGWTSAVTVFGTALSDEQVVDVANLSGTQLLSEALEVHSLDPVLNSLLLALQLDETAETEKDALKAKQATGAEDTAAGVYHFVYMHELPKVDENLRDGVSPIPVTDEAKMESDRKGRERAKSVKGAMQHAWRGYEEFAWGEDELAPRSKRGKASWGNMGVTLVDSLDTLWLMDMKDEFWKARDWVKEHLRFTHASEVSVFETTIRELGGLLSAFDLSGDPVFKEKAAELGDLLLPAFNTNSGIPTGRVNFRNGRNSGSKSVLAEIGTLQVEFRYLSEITGDPKYAQKANKVFDIMSKLHVADGLFPIFFNPSSGKPVTFGALGDSFYEYLLKAWLQGGQEETEYRTMYDRAMDGMTKVLLKKSDPSGLTYVSDWNGRSNAAKMDHLVCFLAGTLALGAQTTDDEERAERDMKTAKALAYTCYQMYARQKTGLAPEMVTFEKGKDMVVPQKTAYNILRPETAEALFVLHQITGDPIYRDWSWEIFQAFEKHCRLPVAFGSFPNVNDPRAHPEDRMESFFLAETLKYLYLIQDPDHKVDLSDYVFNTEAHPLRIFPNLGQDRGAVARDS
eukprot:jgi/Undpi1/7237/HiC_scaffold_22.g09710.m1